MIYIDNDYTNPYFNLAAEEYILRNFKDNCFMLWRNEPSIIIGKNQNTLSEINHDYVKKNNIPVVRRLSGGGAVFHDLGNLNFTFIYSNDNESFNNFRKFTTPIIAVLNELGVKADFSGRNDLTIEGRKFSGNAQYNYRNRVLHHGTLLFSSNMADLSAALNVKASKFQDKAVKSVANRVTNITEHLKTPLTITEFKEFIMNYVIGNTSNKILYKFTDSDIKIINSMVTEKYTTWQWNYGNSPKYTLRNEKKYPGGTVEIMTNIDKGIIKTLKIYGDFFSLKEVEDIEKALIGAEHSEQSIKNILSQFNIEEYFHNISINELIELFL